MLRSNIETNPHKFHAELARFNSRRVALEAPSSSWEQDLHRELKYRILEGQFLEGLRSSVMPMAKGFDRDADDFVGWFESLANWGPGQGHALFSWLATEASAEQMKWFLTQEAAGEAGFEDLVAYTQVKLPARAKLECARNYWDEMGRGKPKAMHGPLLESMVKGLELHPSLDNTVWESLALGNTMLGLAMSRHYAYHSIGALGVIELTAPWRAAHVARGMERLGFPRKMRAYFDLHAALDISHSREWNREVIWPLVNEDPNCAVFIAEGALMRLQCGQLCFDRYSQEFGIDAASPRATHRTGSLAFARS